MTQRCPCGSGDVYDDCCEPLHAGRPAPTAEALMRSRFVAFARGDADYLAASWHPRTRPARIELDPLLRWTRLEIVRTHAGGPFDAIGVVEFRAHHRGPDGAGSQCEVSRFAREDNRWFYLDGHDD